MAATQSLSGNGARCLSLEKVDSVQDVAGNLERTSVCVAVVAEDDSVSEAKFVRKVESFRITHISI